MDTEDKAMFFGSVMSDISDIIPPLPLIDTLQSIIDAINIQTVRSRYPEAKSSTGVELLETIEGPLPFIPSPLELLPSHVIGSLLAYKQKKIDARREEHRRMLEKSRWRRW